MVVCQDIRELVVTQDQLGKRVGVTKHIMCYEWKASKTSKASLSVTLYFVKNMDAEKTCNAKAKILSLTEKASTLCFRVLLLISTSDNLNFHECFMNGTTAAESMLKNCCRIRMVKLIWAKQLVGPKIRIRAYLSTWKKIPLLKLNVTLLDSCDILALFQ